MSPDGMTVAVQSDFAGVPGSHIWTLGGGLIRLENTLINAISDDGATLVGEGANDDGTYNWREGIAWTAAAGIRKLGVLAVQTDGFRQSYAKAVSSDGSIIAGNSTNRVGNNNWEEAFRWTTANGMQGLGVLAVQPNGFRMSSVTAMSSDGAVVVGNSTNRDSLHTWEEAFYWTQANGMVGLGVLGVQTSGLRWSHATAISSNGSVIAGRSSATSAGPWQEAFRWTEAGGMDGLGVLNTQAAGLRWSIATAISGDGSVIVGQSTNNDSSNNWEEAFRWTAEDGMEGLGVLGIHMTGWRLSAVHAISRDGTVIVGQSTNSDGNNDWDEAFRWTKTLGMQSIVDWVTAGGAVVVPAGLRLSSAQAVSADGSIVIGQTETIGGTNPDRGMFWAKVVHNSELPQDPKLPKPRIVSELIFPDELGPSVASTAAASIVSANRIGAMLDNDCRIFAHNYLCVFGRIFGFKSTEMLYKARGGTISTGISWQLGERIYLGLGLSEGRTTLDQRINFAGNGSVSGNDLSLFFHYGTLTGEGLQLENAVSYGSYSAQINRGYHNGADLVYAQGKSKIKGIGARIKVGYGQPVAKRALLLTTYGELRMLQNERLSYQEQNTLFPVTYGAYKKEKLNGRIGLDVGYRLSSRTKIGVDVAAVLNLYQSKDRMTGMIENGSGGKQLAVKIDHKNKAKILFDSYMAIALSQKIKLSLGVSGIAGNGTGTDYISNVTLSLGF